MCVCVDIFVAVHFWRFLKTKGGCEETGVTNPIGNQMASALNVVLLVAFIVQLLKGKKQKGALRERISRCNQLRYLQFLSWGISSSTARIHFLKLFLAGILFIASAKSYLPVYSSLHAHTPSQHVFVSRESCQVHFLYQWRRVGNMIGSCFKEDFSHQKYLRTKKESNET